MPQHDYIELNPDSVPYTQSIDLDDDTYQLSLQWNDLERFYTITISNVEGNVILAGEKLILNQPLWRNINNPSLPIDTIIPLDESGQETEINPGNLNETVFLCLMNGDDD